MSGKGALYTFHSMRMVSMKRMPDNTIIPYSNLMRTRPLYNAFRVFGSLKPQVFRPMKSHILTNFLIISFM